MATDVARSQSAVYVARVQAAQLAGSQLTLGSLELEQIASGAPSSDTSDNTFFYAARVRAAQRASVQDKARLLTNAVRDYPERDDARMPLFAVLQGAGKPQLALSAIQPLISTGYFDRGRGALPFVDMETPLRSSEVRDALETDEYSSGHPTDYVGQDYVNQYREEAVRAQDELD